MTKREVKMTFVVLLWSGVEIVKRTFRGVDLQVKQ